MFKVPEWLTNPKVDLFFDLRDEEWSVKVGDEDWSDLAALAHDNLEIYEAGRDANLLNCAWGAWWREGWGLSED